MKKIFSIIFFFSSFVIFSQNKETKSILAEGKLLYRLEKASWYGTDDILQRFENKKDSLGGYLSYVTEENKVNCIFFSRFDSSDILVRYSFDSLPQPNPINIDTVYKKTTRIESELIKIRQEARDKVYRNTNKFYSFFENTSMNFIPVISKKKRQVFIITASKENGNFILGNDYILTYSKKNKFRSEQKLHNTILKYPFSTKEKKSVSAMHSHIVTDLITSTDICSILLYKDYVDWETHYVIGKKNVSIFDLKKVTLFKMTLKAWKKISEL